MNSIAIKKPAFLAALVALGTALLGGCKNKSGGGSISQDSLDYDTTKPNSKGEVSRADSAAVPRANSVASALR